MINSFKQKYGTWAVVTGGSAGIGKAYSEFLASQGLNIAIVARNPEKLEKSANELRQKFNVEIKTISADLNTDEGIEKVFLHTKDLEVGFLVNNAGNAFVKPFFDVPVEKLTENLTLNTVAPIKLTYHFGKMMKEKGKGGIIFIASIAAYQGISFMANYSAEKAFVLMLGESLFFEFKKSGLDVLVVSPGTTDTELGHNTEGLDNSKLPLVYMKTEVLVKKSFRQLGRKPSMVPGLLNNITVFIGKHILTRKGNGKLWSSIIGRAIVTK